MAVHESLSGQRIEYDDSEPALARIIARLYEMSADAGANENDMMAVAYGSDNPILGPALVPNRGVVTKETLANPAYRVITDLLWRKHVVEHRVDLAKLAASYSIPIADAAARLGVHKSAIQQAIQAGRMPAWVKDGKYFVSERALELFRPSSAGPPAARRVRTEPLSVSIGNVPGMSFRLKGPGEVQVVERPQANVVHGSLKAWRRVGVLSGSPGQYRMFILEPSSDENALNHGPFYVRGHFEVTKKVNDGVKARAEWKDFKPE